MKIQIRILAGFFVLGFFACSKPLANFVIRAEDEKAPAQIHLENLSEKADQFYWEFGDGTVSDEISPVHTYSMSGRYIIRLQAGRGNKKDIIEKELVIMSPQKCLVQLITSKGMMLIELFDETPDHRDNFLKLVEEGFYEDLLFHRVIDGFMIQGGDPNSRNASPTTQLGVGGPGYEIPAEINSDLVHVKGALAAARKGDPVNPEKRSSGSQFYIVQGREVDEDYLQTMEKRKGVQYSEHARQAYLKHGGTPFLDFEYTVFGRVVEGMEVIDSIALAKTLPGDRPVDDISMKLVIVK